MSNVHSCNANAFAERISNLVKEHCDQFAQQENEELDRLRDEVTLLRREVSRLNQKLSLLNDADANGKMQDLELPGDFSRKWSPADPLSTASAEPLNIQEGAGGSLCERTRTMSDLEQIGGTAVAIGTTVDLERKFSDLDPRRKGYIDIHELAVHMTMHLSSSKKKREEKMIRYKHAVEKLNRTLGVFTPCERKGQGNIKFVTFEAIMVEEASVLIEHFGVDVADALLEIRTMLVDEVIIEKLARTFHLSKEVIDDEAEKERCAACIEKYLEPLSGGMILLNAVLIGIQIDSDPEWNGWFVVECCFTLFFLIEFVLNIYLFGCVEHFFGAEWCFNWFDCILVWSAVLDVALTAFEMLDVISSSGDAYHFLLLRLVRLVRVTRVFRVLRLKMFKDLHLMVNGVIAGLRTLFWAIVLLVFLLYVLGVFMRQVIDPENSKYGCELNSSDSGSSGNCSRSEENMELYGEVMFGSVARSMLAMFTCFTEGCTSPDGTPVIWHLWHTHGPLLVLGYEAAEVFITFGVFNLIMAVMVQNTLANAALFDAERQFGEDSEHAEQAHKLHKLLGMLCRVQRPNAPLVRKKSFTKKGLRKLFAEYFSDRQSSSTADQVEHGKRLHLRINQDQFDEMMRDRAVLAILEDLDISGISRGQLFDILDADGSGFLSISEMVDGLMKLRGPADKGDVIATGLSVRQLQKQVCKLQMLMHRPMDKKGLLEKPALTPAKTQTQPEDMLRSI